MKAKIIFALTLILWLASGYGIIISCNEIAKLILLAVYGITSGILAVSSTLLGFISLLPKG